MKVETAQHRGQTNAHFSLQQAANIRKFLFHNLHLLQNVPDMAGYRLTLVILGYPPVPAKPYFSEHLQIRRYTPLRLSDKRLPSTQRSIPHGCSPPELEPAPLLPPVIIIS